MWTVMTFAVLALSGCCTIDPYSQACWVQGEASAFILGKPPYLDASCDGECQQRVSPFVRRGGRDDEGCHCEPMGRWF